MNKRKDIFEKVKHMCKETPDLKVNCSRLARQMNCDRRTISKYIELAKSGIKPESKQLPKKTDGFEELIAKKVKTGAPAIAIYDYLKKHHGFTGR